eukprot:Hpha_TRINITY_DN16238_c0_g1::TRINITY_DN16238_c0_g1_i5::g.14747::m.14747
MGQGGGNGITKSIGLLTGSGGGEVLALLDLLLEVGEHLVEPALLVVAQLAEAQHLLHTVLPELARAREVLRVRHLRLDEGALRPLLPVERGQHVLREQVRRVRHRQRRAPGARLRLHDLVTAELDPVRQGRPVSVAQRHSGLRQQRQDRDTGVTTDHRHVEVLRVLALVPGQEGVRADHVERRHTAQLLRVVHARLLQHLRRDRHRRVHRVADDPQHRVRRALRHGLHQVLHDRRVRVEQVVTGHPRLPRHTGRDQHQVAPLQGPGDPAVSARRPRQRRRQRTGGLRTRRDVRDVSRHTGRVHHVVHRQLAHTRRQLHQKTQRLPDTARGAQHRHLVRRPRRASEHLLAF